MKIVEINVQEPYFGYILSGEKKVEGRLNKGKFVSLEVGDILRINNKTDFKISGKKIYKNFREMIEAEGINHVVPDKKNIDKAAEVYYKFFNEADEAKYGVVAIKIEKI